MELLIYSFTCVKITAMKAKALNKTGNKVVSLLEP
jgi:hypothetical protein